MKISQKKRNDPYGRYSRQTLLWHRQELVLHPPERLQILKRPHLCGASLLMWLPVGSRGLNVAEKGHKVLQKPYFCIRKRRLMFCMLLSIFSSCGTTWWMEGVPTFGTLYAKSALSRLSGIFFASSLSFDGQSRVNSHRMHFILLSFLLSIRWYLCVSSTLPVFSPRNYFYNRKNTTELLYQIIKWYFYGKSCT